jgi:sialidase-1
MRLLGFVLCLPLFAGEFREIDLFRAGEGGYHTYRIPALFVSKKGTLLAFCEGRRDGSSDSGQIDIVLKRSTDGGSTWSPAQVVAQAVGFTTGNPAPVVDRKSGTILLLMTRNPSRDTERQIMDGVSTGTRTVWITRSTDDGVSWSTPEEITSSVKSSDWTWYATGPGNGIQLRDGRLVIACDHMTAVTKVYYSHVIVSDDGGRTWRIGGVAGRDTNESAVAELRDGSLMLNMRSYAGKKLRSVAISKDRGETWSEVRLDENLVDPICQASLIRFGRWLLFSNAADTTRVRMTVKISTDEGKTWRARLVYAGPSAYSSLADLQKGRAALLYERGEKNPYERITFARFDRAWIEGR